MPDRPAPLDRALETLRWAIDVLEQTPGRLGDVAEVLRRDFVEEFERKDPLRRPDA